MEGPARRRGRAWARALLIAIALCGAGAGSGLWSAPPDDWARLVAARDRLAARGAGARDPAGLTARAAYLLAFHHAQDAADVARMRAAADRLERLGEAALAGHVRHAARDVEGAREPARGRTSGASGSPGAGSPGGP